MIISFLLPRASINAIAVISPRPAYRFFLLRLGMHIDVYIQRSVQVLKFLKLVLLSQCLIFLSAQ